MIFGAVMASPPAVSTRLVVFDTEVVDLMDDLDDPIEVLFALQLGAAPTSTGRSATARRGLGGARSWRSSPSWTRALRATAGRSPPTSAGMPDLFPNLMAAIR